MYWRVRVCRAGSWLSLVEYVVGDGLSSIVSHSRLFGSSIEFPGALLFIIRITCIPKPGIRIKEYQRFRLQWWGRNMIYLLTKAERALCSRYAALVCSTCTALFFLGAFLSTPLFGQNIGTGPIFLSPRSLAVEIDGSFVMGVNSRSGPGSIFRVDPVSGDRMIVSDDTTGSGPGLSEPRGLAVEADGSLVMTDIYHYGVIRVDPVTGDQMVVSNYRTGSGPSFDWPGDLVIEADGSLVVMDTDALVRVDPVSGDRMIVSDDTTGSGPVLSFARGLTVEADGSLVVSGPKSGFGHSVLMRVDPVSGDRTIVSDDTTGSGPDLLGSWDLVVETDSSIVALDWPRKAVMRIDLVSGDRMIVSDDTTGSGQVSSRPGGLVIEADGSLVVIDNRFGQRFGVALVRIDPVSGDRTVFSFSSVVTGIEDEIEVPERFSLTGAYPNPFQATTHIGYELQSPYPVELVVYDAVGRQVEVLVSSTQPAGLYEASFEAEGLPNGVYFYRLTVESSTETGRMVLFR